MIQNSISQTKKNLEVANHRVSGKDSTVIPEYNVTAYFVDKTFAAHSSMVVQGKSLETIQEQLNNQRNGLDIIIEKVTVVKRDTKEEVLKNIPPWFMRETDSLLAKHRADQHSSVK